MYKILKIIQSAPMRVNRNNLQTIPRCCSTKPQTVKEEAQRDTSFSGVEDMRKLTKHTLTNLDKRIVVFAGKYKKMEDVPKELTHAAFDRARNKARIKLANYMMLATAIACVGVAISGRRAAERGESVHQMNVDWHKEINKKTT